jgi:hypothetical protein
MAATTRVQRGQRARWRFASAVVFAVLGACGSNTVHNPANASGGNGAGGSSTLGGAGHLPTAGTPSALPHAGGVGALAHGGTGGADNEHLPHSSGDAGCSFVDQCGGCEPGHYVIACSWGEIEVPLELAPDDDDGQAGCLAAQAQEAAGGAAGAAGAGSADLAGAAGALGYPGACHTYHPRGDVLIGCNDGCAETFHEDRTGQCVLRNECCVVLWRMGCSI